MVLGLLPGQGREFWIVPVGDSPTRVPCLGEGCARTHGLADDGDAGPRSTERHACRPCSAIVEILSPINRPFAELAECFSLCCPLSRLLHPGRDVGLRQLHGFG